MPFIPFPVLFSDAIPLPTIFVVVLHHVYLLATIHTSTNFIRLSFTDLHVGRWFPSNALNPYHVPYGIQHKPTEASPETWLTTYLLLCLLFLLKKQKQVQKFLPVAPALVRALRAANAATQTQGLCDALYCAQALAVVPGGMGRLLRAGAAPAVVNRLSAASADRVAQRAVRLDQDASGIGAMSDDGVSGGVEETKAGGVGETKEDSTTATASAAARLPPSSKGFGGGHSETAGAGSNEEGAAEQAGPAERAEALAFAFVGRALEASGGNCLGSLELTAVAEAFRDDPTSAKFDFMDLLLRWASLQEEGGVPHPSAEGGEDEVGAWIKRGPFPAALREGLLQALHGAAEDYRRDSALALLASLLRALGQIWAVEEEEGHVSDDGGGGGGGTSNGEAKSRPEARSSSSSDGAKASRKVKAPKRKRGTFVAFAVRCAAGEVRILLDEALSLLVPAAAREGAGSSPNGSGGGGGSDDDDDDGPGTGQKARGAMGPPGVDPSIGIAAELAGANAAAAASAADASKGSGEGKPGGDGMAPLPAERTPLTSAQLKTIKDQRVARLLRMVPVGLGVAESTIAFLCGGGDGAEEGEGGEGAEEDEEWKRKCRWDELPIDTLQDLQKVQQS